METFWSTNDGKHACLRHNGVDYPGVSPDELAVRLGIAPEGYVIKIDPAAPKPKVRARQAPGTGDDFPFS